MTVGLVYSEMEAAALAVSDAVDPLQTTLRDLAVHIEAAAPGFKGDAAAGFREAVYAWFDVAVTLGPVLEGYAQSLVGVAQDLATTDHQRATEAGRLTDRLGGPR